VKIHPTEAVLEDLIRGAKEPEGRVLRHLAGCEACQARLARLYRPEVVPAPVARIRPAGPVEYDGIFERSLRSASAWIRFLQKERLEAPARFSELLEHEGTQRELFLRNSRRFHTWGLFELLVERSLAVCVRDPAHGEELGRLALRLSELLDAERYSLERIEDLRARAWGHVGNCRRLRSDLRGAEEAFKEAWSHFAESSGDLFEKAILLDLNASLHRARRRFDDAFRGLHRAISIFLELGEGHRAGRALVNLATVHNHSGHPEQGIPLLHRALELIDPEQEPRLLLAARHNLADYLAGSGRFLEARRAYREAVSLYREFPDAWTQNRRRWVEGKIELGLGQPGKAEPLFLAARDGFLAEGVPYDTALVSLELAALYAGQGRTGELKRLAAEMMPIFASRQIHREALAALAFFQQAVAAEQAGVETVRRIAEYLREARHAPELRFPEGLDR
jgi:tetratricopeptide (TPR) repeat protein